MLAAQPDIQGNNLTDAIRVARFRLLVNRWIGLWLVCLNCILAFLIVALAALNGARLPIIIAISATFLTALACAIAVWLLRPAPYDVAQRLDSASRLGDRLSTAIYFWATPAPSGVILAQRKDALAYLSRVQPRELFPLRTPSKWWHTALLFAGFGAAYAYHSAYGPAIPRLSEKAAQSHAIAAALAPVSRVIDVVRGEKKEFADLLASSDRDRQAATEEQKPFSLPTQGDPDAAAKATTKNPALDMVQNLQLPNSSSGSMMQSPNSPVQPGQQAAVPSNQQSGTATDQQQASQQLGQSGQQFLAEKAMQALSSLMGGSSGNNQQSNTSAPPPSLNAAPNAGATSTQSNSGNSQAASAAAQAAQGQTSNSQNSQNQSLQNSGKHTGAGNGASPWQPKDAQDPQLAGNTAKQHMQLQTTGYRGEPGKERSDVAPGTAQIPLQSVAPQTVTTINGAGQDTVPSRYRQYVQDYFQHGGK